MLALEWVYAGIALVVGLMIGHMIGWDRGMLAGKRSVFPTVQLRPAWPLTNAEARRAAHYIAAVWIRHGLRHLGPVRRWSAEDRTRLERFLYELAGRHDYHAQKR